jgi:hypothetical protein
VLRSGSSTGIWATPPNSRIALQPVQCQNKKGGHPQPNVANSVNLGRTTPPAWCCEFSVRPRSTEPAQTQRKIAGTHTHRCRLFLFFPQPPSLIFFYVVNRRRNQPRGVRESDSSQHGFSDHPTLTTSLSKPRLTLGETIVGQSSPHPLYMDKGTSLRQSLSR